MWVLRTQDKASQETRFAPCLATHPLSQASTNGVFLQRACVRLPMCGWCLPAVAGLIATPPMFLCQVSIKTVAVKRDLPGKLKKGWGSEKWGLFLRQVRGLSKCGLGGGRGQEAGSIRR